MHLLDGRLAHERDELRQPPLVEDRPVLLEGRLLIDVVPHRAEAPALRLRGRQVEAERIQLLTVHGAKGLEWDVVALPGLVDGIFPAAAKSVNWAYLRQELPAPLRGDRADLPAALLLGDTVPLESKQDISPLHLPRLRREHGH